MNAVSPAAPLPSVSPAPSPPSPGESGSDFSKTLARVQQTRQTERQLDRQREARSLAHGADQPDPAANGRGAKAAETTASGPTATPAPAPDAAASERPDTDTASSPGGQAPEDADPAAEDATLPPWLQNALDRRPPAADASTRNGPDATAWPTTAEIDPDPGSATDGSEPPVSTQARDALDAGQARFLRSEAGGDGRGGADRGAEKGAEWGAASDAAGITTAGPMAAAEPALQAPGVPAGALSPGTAGANGLSAAGAAHASGAAEAGARQVNAPLHSPGFAPALGAQLNLMVRDGVTEARLNLNPAEMGPISVRIRIDGQHARVEMAAEMAATRQALEQAMPALASALRDSGLTLTGGGVFDQARDTRQTGADGEPGRGGRGGPGTQGQVDAAETDLIRAPATTTPRGVVDLYA